MSGKKARKDRKAFGAIKFPSLTTNFKNGEGVSYSVEADHQRRIIKLAHQLGIPIEKAIELYTRKVGMIPKHKLTEAEQQAEALKRASGW